MIDPGPPRLNFLCRGTREELEREYKPLRTTHVTGYGRCEQLFTLFFASVNEKSTQNSPRSTPEAILMHNLLMVCLGYTPRPAPGSGDSHH